MPIERFELEAPVEIPRVLIYVLRHTSHAAASASWKAFGADPEWSRVAIKPQKDGRFLSARPEAVYIKATSFSPFPSGATL